MVFLFHSRIAQNLCAILYSMQKNWVIREEPTKDIAELFTDEHPIARILLGRAHISNKDEAEAFFSPNYDRHTHDPFLLKNMNRAVERISAAIHNKEKIIVYSDYDADGVCGGVVFHDFFRAINYTNFTNYIPHRYMEGYGLTMERIDAFSRDGAKVLITIDCGVTDYEEIERAQSLGIDVVVIDHHLVPPKWPPAYAVIDYKQEDDTYPSKYLSGAGLAFKTVQGILSRGEWPVSVGWSKWLLDVVAIAAVADMVPLLGENRTLVHYGLKVLSKTRRPGLQELYRSLRLGDVEITSDTIGFTIAPRINAASRLGHASLAFQLLTSNAPEEARSVAKNLEGKNEDRKKIVEQIVAEIRDSYRHKEPSAVIFTGKKQWLAGVLGIVATRLVEEFGRPAFLWGAGGDMFSMEHVKGSCRTIPGINAVEVMRACSQHLLDFGGHTVAGGFSLEEQAVPAFGMALEDAVRVASQNVQVEDLLLEAELSLPDITWEAYNALAKFEPFGQENKKPLFLFKNMEAAYVQLFGPAKNHLKLGFWTNSNTILWALKFGADPKWFREIHPGSRLDIAASFDAHQWMGNHELRLRIEDMRFSRIV